MNRSTKALLCLGLLGLASAQSSVVSVFIPDTDPQPLVASIIGNVSSEEYVHTLVSISD